MLYILLAFLIASCGVGFFFAAAYHNDHGNHFWGRTCGFGFLGSLFAALLVAAQTFT